MEISEELGKSNIELQDFHEILNKLQKEMKSINKNSKKSIMSIESLREDINYNKEQTFKLKKDLEQKQFNEVKIYKKILVVLDQIDYIFKVAEELENKDLIDSLDFIKKIIRKEMSEINLVEIRSIGELFNSDIHKCIGIEEDSSKEPNEIACVIENGYILNGKVLRPASVIISKKIKEEI
ncbi:MAG: nucleotide exchange factor GrpE [Terrisporobacter sp.]|uniref:nucleotide exchange factor GrpE n=1 Tax=Terrisporobacter sp. TaxID=1965305 RepID=UPI002FC81782